MNLKKILCMMALGIAGILGLIFLIDLAVGIPFERSDITTDILVVISASLLVWQGIETYREV